jgi:hypothetical protein
MGLVIRSIRMPDGSYDLCPKILCNWCGTTIDALSKGGVVVYRQQEPYATDLKFYHSGSPCSPPVESKKRPEDKGWLDLKTFMVYFLTQFFNPSQIANPTPLPPLHGPLPVVVANNGKSAKQPNTISKRRPLSMSKQTERR